MFTVENLQVNGCSVWFSPGSDPKAERRCLFLRRQGQNLKTTVLFCSSNWQKTHTLPHPCVYLIKLSSVTFALFILKYFKTRLNINLTMWEETDRGKSHHLEPCQKIFHKLTLGTPSWKSQASVPSHGKVMRQRPFHQEVCSPPFFREGNMLLAHPEAPWSSEL